MGQLVPLRRAALDAVQRDTARRGGAVQVESS
jgi:hypothetical protein